MEVDLPDQGLKKRRADLIPGIGTRLMLALLLWGAICGAACGFLVGCLHVLRNAYAALQQDAGRYRKQVEQLRNGSLAELNRLSLSPFAPCSFAEMIWVRQSLYRSGLFRDAGRIRNGKILCSASFPLSQLPPNPLPEIGRQDELTLYASMPPLNSAQGRVLVHRAGDFYVIPDPDWIFAFQNISNHLEATIPDFSHPGRIRPDGLASQVPGVINNRDWQGRQGDRLFVTICSRSINLCVVSWGSYRAALASNRSMLALHTAVGGLFALALVLLALVLHIRQNSLSRRVRRAIQQNKIRVVYQPIVELSSGRIAGAEALLRYGNGQKHTTIRPDHFVKIAERNGMALALTERVLNRCLKDFGDELRSDSEFRISINLTASDLRDPRLLPILQRRLDEERIAPKRLALELTETSTAAHATAIEAIHQLAQRGHSVQIDDFGTGYSSLSYLRDLHVDTIKIDKSFTHAVGAGSVTEKLIPQIASMAEALSLRLTVEGIETEEQLRYYLAMDRPMLAQGWHFGRPTGPGEFRHRYLTAKPDTPCQEPQPDAAANDSTLPCGR